MWKVLNLGNKLLRDFSKKMEAIKWESKMIFFLIILSLLYLVKNMSLLIPNPQMSTWLFQFVNGFTLELMMYVIQKLQKRKNKKRQGKEKGLIRWWVTEVLNFSLPCVFFLHWSNRNNTHIGCNLPSLTRIQFYSNPWWTNTWFRTIIKRKQVGNTCF